MIQPQTRLKVADNTGAKAVSYTHLSDGGLKCSAGVLRLLRRAHTAQCI